MRIVLLLVLLASVVSITNAGHDNKKFHAGQAVLMGNTECEAVVMDYDTAAHPFRLMLTCITDEFQILGIPSVDTSWIKVKSGKGHLKSGKTILRFPQGTTVNGFMVDHEPSELDNNVTSRRRFLRSQQDGESSSISNDYEEEEEDELLLFQQDLQTEGTDVALSNRRERLKKQRRRRLNKSRRFGASTVGIVRVFNDPRGKSTTHTEAELYDAILSPEPANLRTQFSNCSFGQMTLSPTGGALVTNGVGTVTPTEDPGDGDLTNATQYSQFMDYFNNIFALFLGANGIFPNFIMICIPPSTITNTNSLGFYNSYLSIYNSEVCTYLSYNMHEIGHNLELNHSTDLLFSPGIDPEFGDTTGYMGEQYNLVHEPRMCFNPAKSFQLGWYASSVYTCTPTPIAPCQVNVSGFVSWVDPNVDWVLMKIEDPLSDIDYYLTYNNASDFNIGTNEGANKVVVNTLPNEGMVADFSELVGIVDQGETVYFIGTYNGNQYLAIEVLSIQDGQAELLVTTGEGLPPGSQGDPHFRTWQNEHYEYHGQCDLVLVKDQNWLEGAGLEVQIRTKVIRYWSYIQSAAIRIGTDILEVQGDAELKFVDKPKYWFNLEYQANVTNMGPNGIFPVTVHVRSKRKRIITIDLSQQYPGQKIVISTWKEFVKVDFVNPSSETYGNSVGMLGDFQTGQTYGRNGKTVMDDFWQLGEEWQVLPGTDDMLFHSTEYPQFPEKCVQPEEALGERRRRKRKTRRLDEANVSTEEAEAACSTLKDPLTIKDCIYDVMATQDLEMVGAF